MNAPELESVASARDVLWRVGLTYGLPVLVAVALRTLDLLSLPVFLDEAIHISWARSDQGALAAASHGRWLTIQLMALFVKLPLESLLAARLLSTVAGAITTAAIVAIGRELFGTRVGVLAGLLYACLPFAVLPDRMALADSLSTAFVALTILLSIKATRRDSALLQSFVSLLISAAILAKLSTLVFIVVPILVVGFLSDRHDRSRHLVGSVIVLVMPLLVLIYFWHQGFIWQLTEKTQTDSGRIDLIATNAERIIRWYWTALTPPVVLVLAVAIVWIAIARRGRPHMLLVAVLVVAVGPYLISAGTFFPRYLHASSVAIALLVAVGLNHAMTLAGGVAPSFRHRSFGVGAVALPIWPLAVSVIIAINPVQAPLTSTDRAQYIVGWPSGYGVREAARELERLSATSPEGITLVRFHYDDQPNQGLAIHLEPTDRIEVVTVNPADGEWVETLVSVSSERITLLLVNPGRDRAAYDAIRAAVPHAERVWVAPRPGSREGLEIWRVCESQARICHL